MSQLTLQFDLLRTRDNARSVILSGMPSVSVEDHSTFDIRLATSESHTFTASKLFLMQAVRRVHVVVTFDDDTVLERDVDQFIYLPTACTVVVSNPPNLGYTSPIPVAVVTA